MDKFLRNALKGQPKDGLTKEERIAQLKQILEDEKKAGKKGGDLKVDNAMMTTKQENLRSLFYLTGKLLIPADWPVSLGLSLPRKNQIRLD